MSTVQPTGHRSPDQVLFFESLEARLLLNAPSAGFDWSMPDRYGLDRNRDGLIDLPNSLAYANPKTLSGTPRFDVTLDASHAEPGSSPITEYRWRIDPPSHGALLIEVADAAVTVPLEEGIHAVTLEVEAQDGQVDVISRNIEVQDLLIVTIGDSYASGEGNPVVHQSGSTPAFWSDGLTADTTASHRRAHRSIHSWGSQAALQIEADDPRSSVTYLNFASSGSKVTQGLLDTYAGIQPDGIMEDAQLEQITDIVGDRPIDALFLAIGANDVGFSKILRDLAQHPLFVTYAGIEDRFYNGYTGDSDTRPFPGLNTLRDTLFPELQREIESLNVAPDRVYMAEYPDPTKDETGEICQRMLADHSFGWLGYIDRDEAIWALDRIYAPLAAAGREAAENAGWQFVDGIFEDYNRHGYCSTDRWFRTYSESEVVQGDINGAMHPNVAGHAASAARVLQDFYASDVTPPYFTDAAFLLETPPQRVVFNFSEHLSGGPETPDVTVTNLTTGHAVDPTDLAVTLDGMAVQVSFPGLARGILPDGNYLATVAAGSVEDQAGNGSVVDATLDFFVLAGDADRDRDVDFFDFLTLRGNYGQTDKLFSDGDFDYDGDVDFFDFLILRGNYGVTLPLPESGSLFAGSDEIRGGGPAGGRAIRSLTI